MRAVTSPIVPWMRLSAALKPSVSSLISPETGSVIWVNLSASLPNPVVGDPRKLNAEVTWLSDSAAKALASKVSFPSEPAEMPRSKRLWMPPVPC